MRLKMIFKSKKSNPRWLDDYWLKNADEQRKSGIVKKIGYFGLILGASVLGTVGFITYQINLEMKKPRDSKLLKIVSKENTIKEPVNKIPNFTIPISSLSKNKYALEISKEVFEEENYIPETKYLFGDIVSIADASEINNTKKDNSDMKLHDEVIILEDEERIARNKSIKKDRRKRLLSYKYDILDEKEVIAKYNLWRKVLDNKLKMRRLKEDKIKEYSK